MSWTAAEWLGTATISPAGPVVAGEYGAWTISYTVGVSALDEGGRIRLAWRTVSDWGSPQFTAPGAADYVSVSTSANARLAPRYGGEGVRPWSKTLTIGVGEGALAQGDVVTIVLGDTSGGSPGMCAQTFPERRFRFKLQVDPFGAGIYEHVADLGLTIVGGPATQLVVVAPSDVVAGEPAWLHVRALDRWGNPAPDYCGVLRFTGDVPEGLPEPVKLIPSDRGVRRFEGLRYRGEGILRVMVRDDERGIGADSNPIRCHASAPGRRLYWGDLHGQTEETVGTGSLEEYFAYGRDVAAIDAIGHQGNDFQITNAVYDDLRAHVERFHEPGRYVTFLGYEWSGITPAGGDRNVHYLVDGPIHRTSHTEIDDRSDIDTDRYPLDRLFETFAGREDVVLVPHIGGRPAGLHYHDPALEPAIEIASQWGRFEWFARDALERGYRVGFIGGSDDHSGRPGWSAPTLAHHGVRGGLTGFLAGGLTREALWEAFRARRCYGTSGPRIILDVDVCGQPMGAEVTTDAAPVVRCRVAGTAPLDTVEVRRGLETVHRTALRPAPRPGDPWRVRVGWRGARNRGRSRVLDWTGGLTVSGGWVTSAEGYAIDSPLEGIVSWAGDAVRWTSHTVGDWDGVVLGLEADEDTMLAIEAGGMALAVRLGDLGDDGISRPGPLLEQQIVVQRLAGEDGPREAAVEWRDPEPRQGRQPVLGLGDPDGRRARLEQPGLRHLGWVSHRLVGDIEPGHRQRGRTHELAQRRWLQHFDVGAKLEQLDQAVLDRLDRDGQPDPAVGVRRCVALGDCPRRGRVQHHLGELSSAGREPYRRLGAVEPFFEPLGPLSPVRRQVEATRTVERRRQGLQPDDARDAIGARLLVYRGNEVPTAAFKDEADGIDRPLDLAAPAPVSDPKAPLSPDGVGDGGQVGRRFRVAKPAGRIEVEPLADAPGPLAQVGGQGGHELELRGGEHLAETEFGRWTGSGCQEERLGLAGSEAGQPRAIAVEQPVAAGPAALAVDRHAGRAERVDVPVDRPRRHLELAGQRLRGHRAAGLQQQQNRQQPVRPHRGILPRNPDTRCQEMPS